MPKWAKWTLGIFGLLVVISIASSGGSKNTSKSQDAAKVASGETPAAKAPSGDTTATCGSKATDECTPHVGPSNSARVDALIWRLTSVRQTQTIGEQQYGLGAKANGVFLVLNLSVHSDRNESATLTDSTIKLETDGNTYDADNDALSLRWARVRSRSSSTPSGRTPTDAEPSSSTSPARFSTRRLRSASTSSASAAPTATSASHRGSPLEPSLVSTQ